MRPIDDSDRPDDAANLFGLPEHEGRGLLPDFVRKMAVAGLGALFMTEEGIRGLAGQLKVPKEALGLIIGQAEKTKEEIARIASEEIRRFFQSEKLRDEFLKLLSGMTVEIKAEVRLVPDKDSRVPKITVTGLGAKPAKRTKE